MKTSSMAQSQPFSKREPEIYGAQSFEDFFKALKADFPQFKLDYFQSNREGVYRQTA